MTGSAAMRLAPKPPSVFEYTDDERALRDLAYPLIELPYDRQKWYSVAGEYGLRFTMEHRAKYYERLARNDVERLFEYKLRPRISGTPLSPTPALR